MANTWIVGGRGTMADASNDNGGGHTGAIAWADVMGANGGPLYTIVGASYATATGIITKAGEFATGLTGVIVHTKEGAAGAWAEEWYPITASDVNSITIASGLGDNVDIDVWVGGAFASNGTGLSTALNLLSVASGDNIQIATDVTTATIYAVGTQITTPAVAGSTANPFKIYAVDKTDGSELDLSAARPILQGASINSIINWDIGFDNSSWANIDFDGNDAATYCWHFAANGSSGHKVKNCRFHNATSHGIYSYYTSYYSMWIDNEFDNNGGDGFYSAGYYNRYSGNKFHHNGSQGLYLRYLYHSSLIANLIYANTAEGIYVAEYMINGTIKGNVIYKNGTDGINLRPNTADYGNGEIFNNTIFENGGYGINNNLIATNPWPKDIMYLGYNHSYNNTSGHCHEMDSPTNDAEWLTFMDGNNITGNPQCISLVDGSEDFTLKYSSPLLRAGISNTDIGAGGRLAGGGGAGGRGFCRGTA